MADGPAAGARGVPRRDDVVRALQSFFRNGEGGGEPPPLVAVYLFGSVARDQARPGSDVDVAVLRYNGLARPTFDDLPLALESNLTHLLGAPTQVVVLNGAPVDLIHRVLRDGVLVCERDRSKRIAFEVKSRNQYWDLLPILRRYRRPAGATS